MACDNDAAGRSALSANALVVPVRAEERSTVAVPLMIPMDPATNATTASPAAAATHVLGRILPLRMRPERVRPKPDPLLASPRITASAATRRTRRAVAPGRGTTTR